MMAAVPRLLTLLLFPFLIDRPTISFASNISHRYSIKTLLITEGRDQESIALWRPTFEKYLESWVGKYLDAQLNFSLETCTKTSAFPLVESRTVHFIFASPSIYSCLEAEFQGILFFTDERCVEIFGSSLVSLYTSLFFETL